MPSTYCYKLTNLLASALVFNRAILLAFGRTILILVFADMPPKNKIATKMKKSTKSMLEHLYTATVMHEVLTPHQECL
jgi:hypothetical protein